MTPMDCSTTGFPPIRITLVIPRASISTCPDVTQHIWPTLSSWVSVGGVSRNPPPYPTSYLKSTWKQILFDFTYMRYLGFLSGTSGKDTACQCKKHKRCMFDLWGEKVPQRRAWQSTPVFLPKESQGQRSLVGSRGRKEWDTSEAT